ncbi:hypothetical protein [Microbacterium sp.]|uniref:hypothetical protein n=1 Tax=Microbacterium sp. TaxID=51671 RepID=UPI003F723021
MRTAGTHVVVCEDHDEPLLVAVLDRHLGPWLGEKTPRVDVWRTVESTRAEHHSSSDTPATWDAPERITLRCTRCSAEHRDQPLTVKGTTLSAGLDALPAGTLAKDARGRFILTRTLLRSLARRF